MATKKPSVDGGEIVLVPLYDGRYAITKVLYASRHANFKNTILLAVSKQTTAGLSIDKVPKKFDRHFYTSNDAIRSGLWSIAGKEELSEKERAESTRIHTNKLWCQDEMLRIATAEDKKKFPRMTTAGTILAEVYVREHLGLGEPDPDDDNTNPLYARAYARRGSLLAERGEAKEALEYFKAAIDLDPDCIEAFLARATLHAATGNPKLAAADEKKAAAIKAS